MVTPTATRSSKLQSTTGTRPAERPHWLRAKPSSVVVESSEPPAAPEAPNRGWLTAVTEWLRETRAQNFGFLVSVAVHATFAVTLASMYFLQPVSVRRDLSGEFGHATAIEELDVPFDSKLTEDSAAPAEFVAMASIESELSALGASAERVSGALDGDGTGTSDGNEAMSGGVRIPASAVTKGSFTVWTDPEDPTPGIPYKIIIQVKLPETIKSYRLRDLTGTVRGTDNYHKVITFKSTDRRPVKKGAVQVEIPIPGAEQLVKDTIHVKSKILDEAQTIDIVF